MPIMRHDTDKKIFFNKLSTIVAVKKLKTKAHSFFSVNKWCTSTIRILAWHDSKTKCHLKM